jgi:superfamily I DNA/RNA helicase
LKEQPASARRRACGAAAADAQHPPVQLPSADDERDEADFVATQVLHLHQQGNISSFADVGLVFRTNLQSRVLEEALCRHRIPHRVVGAVRFYERKEVKDVVAYLRLLYNEHDAASMERILNVPPRGVGPQTRHKIQTHALVRNCSLMDALLEMSHAPIASGAEAVSGPSEAKGTAAEAAAAWGEDEAGQGRAGDWGAITENGRASRKGASAVGSLSQRKREALGELHRVLQDLQALVAVSTPAEVMEQVRWDVAKGVRSTVLSFGPGFVVYSGGVRCRVRSV